MALRVEDLQHQDFSQVDYVRDLQQSYLAFQNGDPYYLPDAYKNFPLRHYIGRDLRSINGEPVKSEIISERVLSWNWEGKTMTTVLYVPGPHKEGFTFANHQNPWSSQHEAMALRTVIVGESAKEMRIAPISTIPVSMVGPNILELGREYIRAFGAKDVPSKTAIGREIREAGVQVTMVGANPYFRLAGY